MFDKISHLDLAGAIMNDAQIIPVVSIRDTIEFVSMNLTHKEEHYFKKACSCYKNKEESLMNSIKPVPAINAKLVGFAEDLAYMLKFNKGA